MKQKKNNKLDYEDDPFLPPFSVRNRQSVSFQMITIPKKKSGGVVARKSSENKVNKEIQQSSESDLANNKNKVNRYGSKNAK